MSDFTRFMIVVCVLLGVIGLLYVASYDSDDNHICLDGVAYDKLGNMWIIQSPIRHCISNNEVVRKIRN